MTRPAPGAGDRDAAGGDAAERHAAGRDAAGRDATARDTTARDTTARDTTARDATGRDATGRDATGRNRDRDPAGRPRNARPRDELGRPLGRDADGEPPAADETALPPASALALAQRLIDDGRPFRAHEVLEASWKAAPEAERQLWQGLAQIAVGLTHAQRGNARGAVALLRRGAGRVAGYAVGDPAALAGLAGGYAAGDPSGRAGGYAADRAARSHGIAAAGTPHGIDTTGIARSAWLADLIERDGLDAIPAGGIFVRLYSAGNKNLASG